jgi:cellulose synthase/poly-beta-1,6-N-acetylglucosamine synthase-like glycosyltransferase
MPGDPASANLHGASAMISAHQAMQGSDSPASSSAQALPSRLIRPGLFATGHVTEDLLIGIECSIAGVPPRYLQGVTLISRFPETAAGRDQQKQRWVHGHLAVILTHAPRLVALAIHRHSLPLLALAADVMVPPLTLLAVAHAGLLGASIAFWLILGEWLSVAITAVGMALFCFALATAWHFCGRGLIGRHELLQLPRHMIRVLGNLKAFALGRRSTWVRADRRRLR